MMRVVAGHDQDGTIASLIISPLDAPPVAGATDLDQQVTELEVSDDVLESLRHRDEGGEQRIIEALSGLRVDIKREARLVRR
jgi:hypothetical protein